MKKILNEWRKFLLKEGKYLEKTDYIEDGKIKLYHFSNKNVEVMDPQFFVDSRGSYSRKDWEVSNVARSFFYTDPTKTEPRISSQLYMYTAEVDANRIYDFANDPEKYRKKYRHPTYGLRKWVDWNPMLEEIREKYDGIFYVINNETIPVIAYFKEIKVDKVEKP